MERLKKKLGIMSIFSGVDARWKNVEEILLLHFKLVFPQGSVRCWLRECSMPVFHFLYFFFFLFFFAARYDLSPQVYFGMHLQDPLCGQNGNLFWPV